MDIRRYLGRASEAKKTAKPKADHSKQSEGSKTGDTKRSVRKRPSAIIESDSDEDPIPPKRSSKNSKTLIQIDDDDSGEDFKVRSRIPQKQALPIERKKVEKSPPKVEPISASDYFGSEPVHRSTRTPQKKADTKTVLKKEDDYEINDDDDFKATLQLLDAVQPSDEKKAREEASIDQSSPSKSKSAATGAAIKETLRTTVKSEVAKEMKPSQSPAKQSKATKSATPSSSEKKSGGNFYHQFMHREGPRAPGSKVVPEGAPGCFEKLTFIITGVLDSLDRDEAADLIQQYGGKVTKSLSKNTSYMVVGTEAGPAKLDKAKKLGTKVLSEDGLLDLLRTLPGKQGAGETSTPSKKEQKLGFVDPSSVADTPEKVPEQPFVKLKFDSLDSAGSSKVTETVPMDSTLNPVDSGPSYTMWVDKYKPTTTKQIIGQHGDKSNVKKLIHWLENWHRNQNNKSKKGAFGKWGADDGSNFKAALLSGPPGVGKTTSAQLVCKETNFTYIELNASDTRSKKSLQEDVAKTLQNKSLTHYLEGNSDIAQKHCLLMDEVDGMAGNEDRGGVQELIQLIKSSKIPIICMCNDRMHQKIRSLANYCFDLRFQKPRVEWLKGAMSTVCYKEGIAITPNILQDVIVAANQDVRQILHNLSMWSKTDRDLSAEKTSVEAKKAKKDMKMGPFDVLRMVFSASEHKNMSIHDKSNLFFHDYSIGPLFVQENYLTVQPHEDRISELKHLQLLSRAADSICDGDLVDKLIRSQSHWGLLPVQAMFASVIPGDIVEGHLIQMISFPSWLGRNSTRGKIDRLLQDLHMHTRLKMSGNKTDLNSDYLQHLRNAIVNPLVSKQQEGISEAVEIMNSYHLLREDLDAILEVSLWSKQTNPLAKLSPQVKAAFTRAYNKSSHASPYAVITTASKNSRKSVPDAMEVDGEEEEEIEETETRDDVTKDAMIKKKTASKRKAQDVKDPSTSKKGKGKKGTA